MKPAKPPVPAGRSGSLAYEKLLISQFMSSKKLWEAEGVPPLEAVPLQQFYFA